MRITSPFKRLLGANSFVAFIGVLTGVILARNLSVEDRGELAEILLWVGLGVTIGSESIREHLLSFKSGKDCINRSVLILAASISLLLPIILLIDNGLDHYILYSVVFCVVNLITILYMGRVQLKGRFSDLSLYKVVVPATYFILLATTFFFQVGIWVVLIMLLSANVLLLIIMMLREPRVGFTQEKQIRSFLNVLFSVAVIAGTSQMDKMIMAKVADANQMAYFIVALTIIATPLTIIGQTVSSYLIIDIKQIQQVDIKRYIDTKVMLMLFVLVVCTSIIFAVSEWLISLLFGNKYLPAAAYVSLCSCVAIFSNIKGLYNHALRGLGLNNLVSFIQIGMLSTLLVIFIANSLAPMSVLSTLWFMVFIQVLFFIGFYFIVRSKYLTLASQK